jgi:hypothetical protein
VDEDLTRSLLTEACQQLQQRRLARTYKAYNLQSQQHERRRGFLKGFLTCEAACSENSSRPDLLAEECWKLQQQRPV